MELTRVDFTCMRKVSWTSEGVSEFLLHHANWTNHMCHEFDPTEGAHTHLPTRLKYPRKGRAVVVELRVGPHLHQTRACSFQYHTQPSKQSSAVWWKKNSSPSFPIVRSDAVKWLGPSPPPLTWTACHSADHIIRNKIKIKKILIATWEVGGDFLLHFTFKISHFSQTPFTSNVNSLDSHHRPILCQASSRN